MNTRIADRPRFEWPTLFVALLIFGGYLALSWQFNRLPAWFAAPCLSVLIAWYGSLQHETVHGHPTPFRWVNHGLGSLPLSLWIPYPIYRETHLVHHRHRGRTLTDPVADPESFYLAPDTYARLDPLRRALFRANETLLGRLTIGPPLAVCRFLAAEARRLAHGDHHFLSAWSWHLLGVAVVLGWIVGVCGIPPLTYVAFIVYPSISLSMVRSFAEHRADPDPRLRTAVVESDGFWGLLFLHNNLHIVHHDLPRLPWYALPAEWARMQGSALAIRADRAGMIFRGGYGEVFRRFLLRPVIGVEHPAPIAGR
jgi:fatty acid desaturase